MRRLLQLLCIFLPLVCGCAGCSSSPVPQIIFDTDIGNDIDDAQALDLLYKYQDEGRINLLGICLNKTGDATAGFIDLMSRWYGYPDIPLGVLHSDRNTGVDADQCYTGRVCSLTRSDGMPLFEYETPDYDNLPEACTLYRKLLARAEDASVTIVSVGFFTNLSLLMQSGPDDYSPLTGMELIQRKVRMLSIMAGRFFDGQPEFNVMYDIPAAQSIFSAWPTPMAVLTWELGDMVHYPASSIENDFNWTDAHPLKEAYIRYQKMPYDNTMFDPTAVVYGAGETDMFTTGEPGRVTVSDSGVTTFTPDEDGQTHIIYLSDQQAADILDYFKTYLTRKPKCYE